MTMTRTVAHATAVVSNAHVDHQQRHGENNAPQEHVSRFGDSSPQLKNIGTMQASGGGDEACLYKSHSSSARVKSCTVLSWTVGTENKQVKKASRPCRKRVHRCATAALS